MNVTGPPTGFPTVVETPLDVNVTGSSTGTPTVVGISTDAAAVTANDSRAIIVLVFLVTLVIILAIILVAVDRRRMRGSRTEERAFDSFVMNGPPSAGLGIK